MEDRETGPYTIGPWQCFTPVPDSDPVTYTKIAVEAGREYRVEGTVTFGGPWRPRLYPFNLSREQHRLYRETLHRELRRYPGNTDTDRQWRRLRAIHSAYRRRHR